MLEPTLTTMAVIDFNLTYSYSRKNMHNVRERGEEGSCQRGIFVPFVHGARAAGQLQTAAADRDGAVQGKAQNSLLLLGGDVSRAASHHFR